MGSILKLPGKLQKEIFLWQSALIFTLILALTTIGAFIVIKSKADYRDQTLYTVASSISCLPFVQHVNAPQYAEQIVETLDAVRVSLPQIDAYVLIDRDRIRRYHTVHDYIGRKYEFELPELSVSRKCFVEDAVGLSGGQRRATAAILNSEGELQGYVLALITNQHIKSDIFKVALLFIGLAVIALSIELLVSYQLSYSIKENLLGLEPDVFSAMYELRESILENLDEGVIACDEKGAPLFINQSAHEIIGDRQDSDQVVQQLLGSTLETGQRESHVTESVRAGLSVVIDRIPLYRDDKVVGAIGVMHDRTEYVKLAEDLSGTKYLVDSMRANNHEFTNKLHVILGLIRMEYYDKAAQYIEDVTFVHREGVAKIAKSIDDPALAALLVGKTSNAAEFNVSLALEAGSVYRRSDIDLPSEALVTILGNLINNALEAMNAESSDEDRPRDLLVGIHSQPGALLITVDDSGPGIPEEIITRIFEQGFTTKGQGHGTGLHLVNSLVKSLGGEISVESTLGVGTSFSITFQKRDK